MAANWHDESEYTPSVKFIAMAASLVLCWIIFKVKMKRCEQTVSNTAALLQPLNRAAAAAATRQRAVKAATLVVEKTLAEYRSLITMLHRIPESDFDREDFPPIRQELEEGTIKAQVKMVKDSFSAVSIELSKSLPSTSSPELREEKVLESLYEQEQLVMTISEEILAALDSRKKKFRGYTKRDQRMMGSSFNDHSGNSYWRNEAIL